MKISNIIFALVIFCFAEAKAQHSHKHGESVSFTIKPAGNVAETNLVIENFFADIVIEGTSGNEIVISTDDYEGIPEKAKGLKPLSATGTENTGVGLSVKQEGNVIYVSAASRSANDGEYLIKVPKAISIKAELNSWQAGDFSLSNTTGGVEVRTQTGDLELKDITGPIVAYSLSGDIEVSFSSLNQDSPSSITTTSGDVDVTMPSATKGNFMMGSISGEIYTDMEFRFTDEGNLRRLGGGMSANAPLNGGGVDVTLKSVSGDVFIRKGK